MGAEYEALQRSGYYAAPYFSAELPHVLAAASAVVSRAGAGSLWEFLAAEKPALLIPLRGAATRGDQVRNAALFETLGAAKVLAGGVISAEEFAAALRCLREAEEREKMKAAIRRVKTAAGDKDAAALCAEIILARLRREDL
jgi:UDP-N-acetylglucosamine--N-acetylmuramyl-(pentapeptide) pyrophosphoryl-undecaprenol N-acetylglucosamine transferase